MTATYPATLRFEATDLRIIDHEGRPWLTGPDLARALGYEHGYSISNLYQRNKSEFSPEMSDTTSLMVSGNLKTTVRIFSPRGCHLIAMLARTERAKVFRRWALDVLEGLEQGTYQPEPEPEPEPELPKAPSITSLLQARDRFIRRGNFAVEMENLVRALRAYPEHTSAEVSVMLSISRTGAARLVTQASAEGRIHKGAVRRCGISGRDNTITWHLGRLGVLRTPPALPDYGFERSINSCHLSKQNYRKAPVKALKQMA